MFPGMVNPSIKSGQEIVGKMSVQPDIDKWSAEDGVLAWKLTGAGGGGYLALVVEDAGQFCEEHPEAIGLKIRRE